MVVHAIAILSASAGKSCCDMMKNRSPNNNLNNFISEVCSKEELKGTVTFEQGETGGSTTIRIQMSGVPFGKHGFHIHEFGDLSNGCETAGAHYNPFMMHHGGPNDEVRHVGDLGNIDVGMDGKVDITIVDNKIMLVDKYSVIGRSVVVHEDEDDLGKGGHETSLTTGNSGKRIACGIIGLTKSPDK